MLTDQSRGPFTIETLPTPKGWAWYLIGADGVCLERGDGYTTEAEARRAAAAVRDNEEA